ncbi:hypothetical protein KFE25_004711 [Diacronema lutheri]|uniref:BTB domain-containing protein n=1 Tax=Diacronema lutheri TaxID=2081491 RepID=A0A8J5XGV0_DIALT|nr:hypothetical protein KFE25_004711 [Diacronema lutheri]
MQPADEPKSIWSDLVRELEQKQHRWEDNERASNGPALKSSWTMAAKAVAKAVKDGGPAASHSAADAGAIPLLVNVLMDGSEAGKTAAAFALGIVATEPDLRALIEHADARPWLAELANGRKGEAKSSAEAALRNLDGGELRQPVGVVMPADDSDADCAPATLMSTLPRTMRTAALGAAVGDAAPAATHSAFARNLNDANARARELERDACEAKARLNALERELRAMGAASVGEHTVHGTVTLRCADGVELRASRFMLEHTSPHFRQLFESSPSRVLAADAAFSSAAHAALLSQLHSLGVAPLPDAPLMLELLALAAAQRRAARAHEAADGSELSTTLRRVIARCEQTVIREMSVHNCLDLLLLAKASGSSVHVLQAAEAMVKARFAEVVAQPRMAQYLAHKPHEAAQMLAAMLSDVTLENAQLRRELGGVSPDLTSDAELHLNARAEACLAQPKRLRLL